MHLANGTLANQVCTVTAAASAATVAYTVYRARFHATPDRLLKTAAGAAIVFLAQMIDVPLFSGVGVHLVGATFLVLLAGPLLALPGMAAVIAVQALVLHDGGVTALGANVLNMAVVAVGAAAMVIALIRTRIPGATGLLVAASLASVASVMAAVSAMSIELAFSGTPLRDAFTLTMSAHAPFAAWETAATFVLVLAAVRVRAVETPAARVTG